MPKPISTPPGFSFIRNYGGITEYRLRSNDMRILTMADHALPVAVCMVTYHVGSRNEVTGNTGATHLLEHLMFKDSKKFRRKNGKDVWTNLEGKGAHINATTWLDRTNYFEIVPKKLLFEALAFEADRMRNALLLEKDRAAEMTVVRNEFERGENEPTEAVEKQLWALAYQAHPYHHSTIGWRSDIEKVPIEKLREFYDTFYWPNNATLTVIGDFDEKKVFKKIRATFGRLSPSPRPIPVIYTEEPPQAGSRQAVVERRGATNITALAYKTPAALHPDMPSVQILGRVFAGGKESRLYRALVDGGFASDLALANMPLQDGGLCSVYAFLNEKASHGEILSLMRREAAKIKTHGVTLRELAGVKGRARAETAMSRDGVYALAASLNEAIAVGDWKLFVDYEKKLKAVTATDVKKAAEKYFNDAQSTSCFYIAKK